MIQTGKIKQHIYQTYSLEESPDALQEMMDRKVIGKAVVVVNEKMLEHDKELIQKSVSDKNPKTTPENGAITQRPLAVENVNDLKKLIGKSLGKSSWVTVSQDIIQQFAETTQDLQWIHVDTVKAKAMLPGGKNLAHGYLTLSLIPKLMYELLPLDKVQMALNYGTDKVRFPAPVYSGDQVQLQANIESLEENPDGSVRLIILAEVLSNHSDKPVCVAEMISLIRF